MTLKRSLSRFIGAAASTDISLSAGLRLSPRHDIFGINCSPYGTGGGGYTTVTVSGTSPLSLPKAIENGLQSVKVYGGTSQSGTPTPDAPIDIVSNNGVLKWDSVNQTVYADGTVETIEDTIGNTATAEILLKLGNYRDVQSIIDGVVTRNVGILVLDGTESWTVQGANYPYFRVDFSQDFSESTYLKGGKCTHFKDRYITPTTNQQGFYLNRDSVTQKTFIALRFDSLFPATSENVNNLKTWLANQYSSGAPVIIAYPLVTATTETVTGQTLQVQAGDNTLEITQASLNNLELEAKYKKSK